MNLTEVLGDLTDANFDEKEATLSRYISSSDSSGRVKELVDVLCQRTLKDKEFAPLAGKVANKLCSDESFGGTFRGTLLKSTQEIYKNREDIRKKSVGEWFGLVALICELFNHLRTGGAPLKVLAGAVYQTLRELLLVKGDPSRCQEELEEDEVDCFYQHLKTVGKSLEEADTGKMDQLFGVIRDTILADDTTAKTRCLLVELLELRLHKYDLGSDVQSYYCDKLTDIMAQEI